MQALGYSSRESQSPWIVYSSPATSSRITLHEVFSGLALGDLAQQALLLVQLVRKFYYLNSRVADASIQAQFSGRECLE